MKTKAETCAYLRKTAAAVEVVCEMLVIECQPVVAQAGDAGMWHLEYAQNSAENYAMWLRKVADDLEEKKND